MSKKSIQNFLWGVVYSAWVVVAFLLASLGVGLLTQYAIPVSWYDWFGSSLGSLVLAAVIYFITTALVLLPLLVRRVSFKELLDKLGLSKPPRLSMVTWSLFLWGLYFACSLVVVIILSTLQLPGLDLQQEQEIGFRNLQYGYEFVAAFLALVVLAPLFEEIIFRGYLYGRLRRRSGVIFSMVVTSLVFGLVHFQLNVAIDVFVLSLFLCFAREKFGSIWPGVFIHAFKNGIAYTLLFILPLYGVNLVQ